MLKIAKARGMAFALGVLGLVASAGRADADGSSPAGTWYINRSGERIAISISFNKTTQAYTGYLLSNKKQVLQKITWSKDSHALGFVAPHNTGYDYYSGRVVEGILQGRSTDDAPAPPSPANYTMPITAWNATYLDRLGSARVYNILIAGAYKARVTLDRDAAGMPIGRFKIFASTTGGATSEEPEYELEVSRWDSGNVVFTRTLAGGGRQTYTGRIVGQDIQGTFQTNGDTPQIWNGTRVNVLFYGLKQKSPAERAVWQNRTRLQIKHLIMKDNPAPAFAPTVAIMRDNMPPLYDPTWAYNLFDDSDPAAHPQNYHLRELVFAYDIPNPYGSNTVRRIAHGYMAIPDDLRRGERLPAVLALNGHAGSAYNCFIWWWMYPYGDAFARRRYIVLSIDMSHRAERTDNTVPDCYIPSEGNQLHPSVIYSGFTNSDWEEDGERTWDAMKAIDYLRTLRFVDANRIMAMGLSLGGEITTYAAALDPRIRVAIPAGFGMDFNVQNETDQHHRCWAWNNSDIRDYIDTSDLHALMAPRKVIFETGDHDPTFSAPGSPTPFAKDKLIARRALTAYGDDSAGYAHYLHHYNPAWRDWMHIFRFGDHFQNNPTAPILGVTQSAVRDPRYAGDIEWQTLNDTTESRRSIFDYIAEWLR